MKLNIGIITTEECDLAISMIEELKGHLSETKDEVNEKPYKLVYYALCKLQGGINKIVEEATYQTIETIKTKNRNNEQTDDKETNSE